MVSAKTTEKAFNFAFCSVLRNKHPQWQENLAAEQTQVIADHPGKTPDIVLSLFGLSPVVIETEFMPAASVQSDAKSRLREILAANGLPVEHSIALRIPECLKFVAQNELESAIEKSSYSYCSYSLLDVTTKRRWPQRGWLEGDLNDVANFLESISLTESLVSKSTEILQTHVAMAANVLAEASAQVQGSIAQQLCQSAGEQTNRMACAIIANAMIFHSRVEGYHGISTLSDFQAKEGGTKAEILHCWRWIFTNVNYWPIFKIATDLLNDMSTLHANQILKILYQMASSLTVIGATALNDLSGRMFQKLIADRKFLATFYTLPVSSVLLSELVVSRLEIDWRDAQALTALKLCDFACGTGTLLGALYQSILSRHRRAGGDDSEIHASLMEESLYAFDIMPAATHLTASTLSNAHPNQVFGTTKIVTMPYGKDDSNRTHIGSLELIEEVKVRSLLSLGRHQLSGIQAASIADDAITMNMDFSVDHDVDMFRESLDIVIMNPPFTRPTKHIAANKEVPVPSFAGFNTSAQEQAEMSQRLKQLTRSLTDSAGHGNAGLASNFIDLAHVKLKPGGLLGLVLPATFAAGGSWAKARQLLVRHYSDISLVSITNSGRTTAAFSADTGIAEVLVIATKNKKQDDDISFRNGKFQFVNLRSRPHHFSEAAELAKFIHANRDSKGSGAVLVGSEEQNGVYLNEASFNSAYVGLSEPNLAKFMSFLEKGEIISSRTGQTAAIPVTQLGELGSRGIGDRDITGKTGGQPRGPFDLVKLKPQGVPTYSTLWRHRAERERSFIVDADYELQIRPGYDELAAKVWKKYASLLHINRDFGLNSQSLAACFTPEQVLGGRAWPSFLLNNDSSRQLILLWFNSSIGVISHWWLGSKQQPGRSILTVSRLPQLISVDPRKIDPAKLKVAEKIFDQFKEVEFMPASQCYRDQNRIALDVAILVQILGVPTAVAEELDVIRKQWCAEPRVSIRGTGTKD